jgi:Family of unknown function (DUF5694)
VRERVIFIAKKIESKSGADRISLSEANNIMKFSFSACFLAFVATNLSAQNPVPDPPPIQVMVLGTYHFGNPGLDLHNMKVDNVLTPAKRAELADVAARLAKFNPTKIAIEALSDRADFGTKKFADFKPEELATNPDERVQIAYRLAQQLDQKIVYGIDEQSKTIDYFPFDKVDAYTKAHRQTAALARLQENVGQMMKQMEAAQKTTPIRIMLADQNEPARILANQQVFYYGLLAFGDQKEQPGAELNAGWYQRNAKIFAKLAQIARPGDRVLVAFGAGHAFWLRHLVQNTPGFELVEPNVYLR